MSARCWICIPGSNPGEYKNSLGDFFRVNCCDLMAGLCGYQGMSLEFSRNAIKSNFLPKRRFAPCGHHLSRWSGGERRSIPRYRILGVVSPFALVDSATRRNQALDERGGLSELSTPATSHQRSRPNTCANFWDATGPSHRRLPHKRKGRTPTESSQGLVRCKIPTDKTRWMPKVDLLARKEAELA